MTITRTHKLLTTYPTRTPLKSVSPPSQDAYGNATGENPPFGDQGVSLDVESIQGTNWVNYMDVTVHKFIQNIPPDTGVVSEAKQMRLMVFDDFAMLLFGDRLYFAATGFGDGALWQTDQNPYYYGGNVKTELKLT